MPSIPTSAARRRRRFTGSKCPREAARACGCVSPTGRTAAIRSATDFDTVLSARVKDADEFYATVIPPGLSPDAANVMRQALAGLLWSKQYFHYDVLRWLEGDPTEPAPPAERWQGRNRDWTHHFAADVISMPDKWEYPWYAAWDQAFHCVTLAMVDARFAKEQLLLLLREWYMHPNGQTPAYEWAFGDVNPPLFGWAALRVYQIERLRTGTSDLPFLHRVFHKLLLNFTWWVNRKDAQGNNIFQGGFLGLDNIGIFDRSAPLPPGVSLGQADGTSWMAVYCANLFRIATELAVDDPTYEDLALKFYEHFLAIALCHEPSRPGRHEPLGRGGRLLLRRGPAGRRGAAPDQGALARRPGPAPRDRGRGRREGRPAAGAQRAHAVGAREPPGTSRRTSATCSSAASSAACSPPW